jgi:nicotinate-nucleotide adenylyltransferase
MSSIGIFGGTFDPIHYGHLRAAWELLEALALDQVRFVPAALPPHRAQPRTPAALRLRMVEAAIAGEARFVADAREIERGGPSYTVETLASLRREFPRRPLCLLLGMDAFLGLPSWHRWTELFDLAHIVVAHRPGWRLTGEDELGRVLAERRTRDAGDLHSGVAGRVHVQAVTQLEISSSGLRRMIAAGRDPKYLLPDPVREMIVELNCYKHTAPGPASAGADAKDAR